MCRLCASVRGESWKASRHFVRNHLTSKEHVQNMRDLRELEEAQLRAKAESTREASDVRRLNVLDVPFAREKIKRPRLDVGDLQVNDQNHDDYLDDFTFSAGQHMLEDSQRLLVARDPSRPLRHGIVDKFGQEADEADITISSVVGILNATGE